MGPFAIAVLSSPRTPHSTPPTTKCSKLMLMMALSTELARAIIMLRVLVTIFC